MTYEIIIELEEKHRYSRTTESIEFLSNVLQALVVLRSIGIKADIEIKYSE